MVLRVLEPHRRLRHLERLERVHHHRELVRVLRADAGLRATRMWPMRKPVGVVRDATILDALSAHELARGVEQDLVRVHVAVIVRRGDRLRIEVVWPRAERADHEAIALERLMDRRGLMDPTNDRLEVVDAEDPRIEVAIPTNDVEWVMIEDQLVQRTVLLHENPEVALLVVRPELDGTSNVPLTVRRSLEQLTEFVAVAFGPADVSARLEDEQLRLLSTVVELPAMGDVPVDNYIISLCIRQVTVHGF